MLKQSLIDKYRPKNLNEIVGQKAALKPIRQALRKGMLMQRICLVGDSGVGKTTTALCIARALNCQSFDKESLTSCGKCQSCTSEIRNITAFNMISCAEMGTSQSEVASLVRMASMPSVFYNYRVIFLDEVHEWQEKQSKLTTMLDTLPSRTFVICATYKQEKLEKAFRKRFHTIYLDLPSENEIYDLLKKISRGEGVSVPDKQLREISSDYEGDPREAVNALERLIVESD